MSSLSKINSEIAELSKRLAHLMNQKVYLKFLDTLDLQESEMQRTSDIEVITELQETSSPTDEYGYLSSCVLDVKYNYTTVEFITPTDVKTNVVTVKFHAQYSIEQTYECRSDSRINCTIEYEATKDDVILQRDSLNQQDYDNEEGLEYDKNAGCYLHLVDAIYTKLEGEDDSGWLQYVREIRGD